MIKSGCYGINHKTHNYISTLWSQTLSKNESRVLRIQHGKQRLICKNYIGFISQDDSPPVFQLSEKKGEAKYCDQYNPSEFMK